MSIEMNPKMTSYKSPWQNIMSFNYNGMLKMSRQMILDSEYTIAYDQPIIRRTEEHHCNLQTKNFLY